MGALVTVMVSPHLADGCAVAKDAAAALVADGWQKPRILTEPEELDVLPTGTVILSLTYVTSEGMQVSFQKWADGRWHRGRRNSDTHPTNILPAIHLGGLQARNKPEGVAA